MVAAYGEHHPAVNSTAIRRLYGMQRHLERIYDLGSTCEVTPFVTSERAVAEALDTSPKARDIREKLLIRQEGEDVGLALYLDERVMEVIGQLDPMHSLSEENFEEFLLALEGVSHFLYVVWNATRGRSVSLFELELQAEVDKFATAALLLARQRGSRVPRGLHERLFAAITFDPRLGSHAMRRYQSANDYAARYCARLERECLQSRRTSLVRELRRFYRLTHRHKLAHIARTA